MSATQARRGRRIAAIANDVAAGGSAFAWAEGCGRSVAKDVSKGLCSLHALGMVHNDMKTGNILINKHNEAKVGDVGLTGGEGVDVVYDPVGGEVWERSLQSTAWGARVAIVGWASGGEKPRIRSNYVLIKGLTVLGCRAGESVRRGHVDQGEH